MGRPRKPTALKILEGAQPCRINRDEPSPPKGIGEPPDFLDDAGRAAWARIASQLDEAGLLTVADREAVALYCSAFGRWAAANAAIDEEGLVVMGQFGAKPNPHLAIADQAAKLMARLLTQFGGTPSSRSSLKVGARVEEDPLLAFLAAKKPAHAPQAQPKPRPKAKAKAKA